VSNAIGKVGHLSVAIPDSESWGEVIVNSGGVTTSYLARSPRPLDVGAAVLVVGVRGLRSVDVEPWEGL